MTFEVVKMIKIKSELKDYLLDKSRILQGNSIAQVFICN